MLSRSAILVALLAAAVPVQAHEKEGKRLRTAAAPGEKISERRPAAPDGVVEIENPAGSIRVTGWNRDEIEVSGTLGQGADALEWTGSARRARIEVETSGNPRGIRSDLEFRVPAGSRLRIESFAASIDVSDVKGSVKAESVDGSIHISGAADEVSAETVNGSVEISGAAKRVNAESVNGPVSISGAGGEIAATTVNGALTVSAGAVVENGHLETVNGHIRFEGTLGRRATLDIESVSGSVELVLPAQASADFSISTFSGEIDTAFGGTSVRTTPHTPQKELTFAVGGGDAKITIETLSGNVEIRKK